MVLAYTTSWQIAPLGKSLRLANRSAHQAGLFVPIPRYGGIIGDPCTIYSGLQYKALRRNNPGANTRP